MIREESSNAPVRAHARLDAEVGVERCGRDRRKGGWLAARGRQA